MASVRAMVEESPRMTALYDFLKADTSKRDRKWAEYVALSPDLVGFLNPKRGPAVVSPASSPTRSTMSLRVPRSAVPADDFNEPAAMTSSPISALGVSTTPSAAAAATTSKPIPMSADIDIVVASPTTCSTVCLGGDTSAASVMSTPAAAHEVFVAVGVVHSSCDNAQAARTHEIDFPSASPTSCSMDCLGGDIDATPLTSTPAASVPDQAAFEVHESGNVLISSISVLYIADLVLAPTDACLDTSELVQVMVKAVLRSTVCPYDDEVADASLMADSMSSSRLSMVEQVDVDFTSETHVYMVAASVVVPAAGNVSPASVPSLVVVPELVPRADLQLKPPWPSFAWSSGDVSQLQPWVSFQGLQQGAMVILSLNVVLTWGTGQLPGQLVLQRCRFLQVWKRQFLLVAFVELKFWPSWQLDSLVLTEFRCCRHVIVSTALASNGDSMAAFVELKSWSSWQLCLLVSWGMRKSCVIFHIAPAVSILDIVDASPNLLGPEFCNREVSFGSLAASSSLVVESELSFACFGCWTLPWDLGQQRWLQAVIATCFLFQLSWISSVWSAL